MEPESTVTPDENVHKLYKLMGGNDFSELDIQSISFHEPELTLSLAEALSRNGILNVHIDESQGLTKGLTHFHWLWHPEMYEDMAAKLYALTEGKDFDTLNIQVHTLDHHEINDKYVYRLEKKGFLETYLETEGPLKGATRYKWLWHPKAKAPAEKKKRSRISVERKKCTERLELLRELFPDGMTAAQVVRRRVKLGFSKSNRSAGPAFLSVALKNGDLVVDPGKQRYRYYRWPNQKDGPKEKPKKKTPAAVAPGKKGRPKDPFTAKRQEIADQVAEIEKKIKKLVTERNQTLERLKKLDDFAAKLAAI